MAINLDNNDLDILDMNIDDLADFVGFLPIPAGRARIVLTSKIDDSDKAKPMVRLEMELKEMLEASNAADVIPEVGHKSSVSFFLKKKDGKANEMAVGQLKAILKVLQPVFGGDSARQILENSGGAECDVVLKVKVNKEDPDQKFNIIKSIALTEA